MGVEDDHGTRVVEKLLAAADGGSGFARYHDGEPKTAYAVEYISGLTSGRPVLVGGYAQDVSHVPVAIADPSRPAVSASEVVDRETLIALVEEAAEVFREGVMSEGCSGYTGVTNAVPVEGGDRKSGSISRWVVGGGGIPCFMDRNPVVKANPRT